MPIAPYSETVNRNQPGCICFMLDQSASTAKPWGAGDGSKAAGVASLVNETIATLIAECQRGEADPRGYYHVGVLGSGKQVGSVFSEALAGRKLVRISEGE
jgi:hypothetical protein